MVLVGDALKKPMRLLTSQRVNLLGVSQEQSKMGDFGRLTSGKLVLWKSNLDLLGGVVLIRWLKNGGYHLLGLSYGRKELNMDRGTAHAILNQVKMGMYFSQGKINEALYTTGDLDITKLTPKTCSSLRSDGIESCYVRSSTLEDAGIGGGFKWSVDWDRKRNSNEIEGIER